MKNPYAPFLLKNAFWVGVCLAVVLHAGFYAWGFLRHTQVVTTREDAEVIHVERLLLAPPEPPRLNADGTLSGTRANPNATTWTNATNRFETSSDTDSLARKDTDIPKESGLITLLKKMGIQLAFDPSCEEIRNMCDLPVYISMMRQKAKIKVNEDGSEAAAVTVAGARGMSLGSDVRPNPKATFHANRPFVYVIREASSGVIIFVGKYTGE